MSRRLRDSQPAPRSVSPRPGTEPAAPAVPKPYRADNLNAVSTERAHRAGHTDEPRGWHQGRVLVVHPDAEVAEAAAAGLQQGSLSVIHASDGRGALRQLRPT